MIHLFKSKWTSVKNLNGGRHYQVLNIYKKKQEVEMFCVCESDLKVIVPINDLLDKSKGETGRLGNNKGIKSLNIK